MDYLTSQATVKNCIGWTFSPLMAVGSPVGNLLTTPANEDYASRVGCKQQSFTSWDCVSRLYIGGAVVIEEHEDKDSKVRSTRDVSEHIPSPDVPTKEELEEMEPMNRRMFKKEMRVFFRGHGVMTQSQFEKYHKIRSRKHRPTAAQTVVENDDVSVETPADTSTEGASGSKGPERHGKLPPLETGDLVHIVNTSVNNSVSPIARRHRREEKEQVFFYSDTVPVRVVSSSSMLSARETEPMPWSATYQLMAGRLGDPASTGVLAAVVKSPNVRDATTWTSLVKAIMLRQSTVFNADVDCPNVAPS